jgi:hypothetical protein
LGTQADDLAKRVGAIYCTSCGAPVDIRKDHACPYCSAAFSLLDPQAVARALEGYAQASGKTRADALQASAPDIGDALVASARVRSLSEHERVTATFTGVGGGPNAVLIGDLLTAGVAMVWRSLQD